MSMNEQQVAFLASLGCPVQVHVVQQECQELGPLVIHGVTIREKSEREFILEMSPEDRDRLAQFLERTEPIMDWSR